MLSSEIRRMIETDTAPRLSQEELDKQKAEFFAKGGTITKHEIIVRDYDIFTPSAKKWSL